MGAPIIGRTACPECSFGSAHVKRSEKCTFRYCPECGAQHHARTARQLADLLAKTRLEEAPTQGTPTPTQASPVPGPSETTDTGVPTPTPSPVATPTPAPTPRKRVGLF